MNSVGFRFSQVYKESALAAQTDIPRFVRELRERTSLTQEKFAARLGVTFPTINRWENGRAKPSPLALKQIEDLLRNMGEQGADLLDAFFKENK
jgi:DNA-binding transcriptional regulator YiaG